MKAEAAVDISDASTFMDYIDSACVLTEHSQDCVCMLYKSYT